jgi:tetratricopeptide (TPR) repeat protein
MVTGRRANLVAAIAIAGCLLSSPRALADQQDTAAALRARALQLTYDLDYDEALALLRRAVARDPDDPATHRALANVLWLHLLFTRGAVTVDHYLGSFSRASVDLEKPAAGLDAEFRKHVARAIQLAERKLAGKPQDVQAHYDLGAAVGLQASYTATIDGRMLAGFRAARRSFDEHERVLGLDASRKDAGLIVGTYRYIVSTLSLPMRMMAYVAGFGGGRDRGISLIEEAAAANGENRVDALFALVLVYNRERRFDSALKTLQELRRLHPRNRLVLLEAGSTALRAGRPQQADVFLTEGLTMLAADDRPRMPGEAQLWRYKRGAARVASGRLDEATADLQVAAAQDAAQWVQGRARVEIARIALKRGDKTTAGAEARTAVRLCEQGHDPVCAASARELARLAHGR